MLPGRRLAAHAHQCRAVLFYLTSRRLKNLVCAQEFEKWTGTSNNGGRSAVENWMGAGNNGGWSAPGSSEGRPLWFPSDIVEAADTYTFFADLPGVTRADTKVCPPVSIGICSV